MSEHLDALEDSQPTPVSKGFAEEQVADWKMRLHALFKQISDWAAKDGWHVDMSGAVLLHEERMEKLGIPETTQPTLRLDSKRGYALFKPKGLWVIGANGRVDLYTSKGTFIIVDLAEKNSSARWTIFRTKPEGVIFKPELIDELV